MLEILFRGFWSTLFFLFEIVNLWKLAPRLHESSIFKVWRGLVLYIFVIFWGVGFGMAPGIDFEWLFDGFWEHCDFEIDEKRERFREWFLKGLKRACRSSGPPPKDIINRILSELKEILSPVPEGSSNQDRGLLPMIWHALGRWPGEFTLGPFWKSLW